MFGGDVLLQRITPNVGVWEDSRPTRSATTSSRSGGSRSCVAGSSTRATAIHRGRRGSRRETRAHHDARLDATEAALRAGAETPFEVSMGLWGAYLGMHEQRFALAEALAHLVRLAPSGGDRAEPGRWRAP